jgi:diketogulonate reductase-like aldo/keto reductase
MVQNQEGDKISRTIALNNGTSMPCLGLGTYNLKDADKHPQLIYEAIVNGGYRLLDCATLYANEEIVG